MLTPNLTRIIKDKNFKFIVPGRFPDLRRRLLPQDHDPEGFLGVGVFPILKNFPNLEKVFDALSRFLFDISASSDTPSWILKSSGNKVSFGLSLSERKAW
jgi:hypothetical protein